MCTTKFLSILSLLQKMLYTQGSPNASSGTHVCDKNLSSSLNTNPIIVYYHRSPSCSLVYQSQCTLSRDEGFTGEDVTYLCNVTSDPTMVDWVPIGVVDVMRFVLTICVV